MCALAPQGHKVFYQGRQFFVLTPQGATERLRQVDVSKELREVNGEELSALLTDGYLTLEKAGEQFRLFFMKYDSFEPWYDTRVSFEDNCKRDIASTAPKFLRDPELDPPVTKIFGLRILSRVGISPCGPTTSAGVKAAAGAGCGVITYKTVRSHEHPCFPTPNLAVLKASDTVPPVIETKVALKEGEPFRRDAMTLSNSMGVPSSSLEEVIKDIKLARSYVLDDQILVVSILGSEREGIRVEEDFANLAAAVQKAGAHVIEANLSCPNLHGVPFYKDKEAVFRIVSAIWDRVSIPITIKVGVFDSEEQMREVFIAASDAGALGIAGINAVGMPVVDTEGAQVFGSRKVAGVSGEYIRPLALDFLRTARRIIEEEKLLFILTGTGGVMTPEHIEEFLELADVVTMATAMIFNPTIVIQHHLRQRALLQNRAGI